MNTAEKRTALSLLGCKFYSINEMLGVGDYVVTYNGRTMESNVACDHLCRDVYISTFARKSWGTTLGEVSVDSLPMDWVNFFYANIEYLLEAKDGGDYTERTKLKSWI